MTGRTVDEWIGKTPDTPIPPRVKLRILDRQGHRCAITGIPFGPKFQPEFDHEIALANGGENRESNLRAIIAQEHKKKTAQDVKAKSKSARIRKKRLGLHQPRQKIPGSRGTPFKRKIGGETVRRDEE